MFVVMCNHIFETVLTAFEYVTAKASSKLEKQAQKIKKKKWLQPAQNNLNSRSSNKGMGVINKKLNVDDATTFLIYVQMT